MIRIVLLMALVGSACGADKAKDCDAKRGNFTAAVEAVRADHRACAVTADCTMVDLVSDCGPFCSLPVAIEGAAVVEQAVVDANARYCGGYKDLDCPDIALDCATIGPTCDNNLCISH